MHRNHNISAQPYAGSHALAHYAAVVTGTRAASYRIAPQRIASQRPALTADLPPRHSRAYRYQHRPPARHLAAAFQPRRRPHVRPALRLHARQLHQHQHSISTSAAPSVATTPFTAPHTLAGRIIPRPARLCVLAPQPFFECPWPTHACILTRLNHAQVVPSPAPSAAEASTPSSASALSSSPPPRYVTATTVGGIASAPAAPPPASLSPSPSAVSPSSASPSTALPSHLHLRHRRQRRTRYCTTPKIFQPPRHRALRCTTICAPHRYSSSGFATAPRLLPSRNSRSPAAVGNAFASLGLLPSRRPLLFRRQRAHDGLAQRQVRA